MPLMPNSELSSKQRKLVALSLFSMVMKIGPIAFSDAEEIVDKVNIREEFEFYAKDWIDYKTWLKKTSKN